MLNHFLRSLIDWVFRRRSVGASLIKVGAPLYALVLVSLSIGITIPTKNGPLVFSWDTSGGSAALSWGVFAIATAIVATRLFLVIRDYRRENRQKVIVIEARGLRDWQGEPLEKAVPPSVPGRRDAVIVDVRQGLIDGQIVAPERALQKLASLPDDVARRTSGTDRSDISFVLGGRGDQTGVSHAGRVALGITMAVMAVTASILLLLRGQLVAMFIERHDAADQHVAALAVSFLVVAALFQFFDGAQATAAGMLRGLRDTFVPMLLALIGYWVIGLGTAIALGFRLGWGGLGVWIGLAAGLGSVAVMMVTRWSLRRR